MSARWQPPYSVRSLRYVYIPMRDGVRLACDIFRPAAEGRFPCLMVRTPYNKNGFGPEAAEPWVKRGYVLCVVDARGAGASEGEFTYYNLPAGRNDGADVVNWLAAQEFCDGNVGTFGGSALGANQILAAEEKPPALKAMYAEVAPVDFYQDNWFPGGIFAMGGRIDWLEGMTGNTGPRAALGEVEGEMDPEGDRIRRQVALRRVALRDRRLLEGRSATPQEWMIPMRKATERGPFWDRFDLRPIVRGCHIPTTYRGIWHDHFVRGTCESYLLHPGPKRLIVCPGEQGVHGEHADLDVQADRARWFDYWLRGIENGVMEEPPVRLFVMGEERWREFNDWPPPGRTLTLALSDGGALRPPERAEPFQDAYTHDPADPVPSVTDVQDIRPFESRALTYTSEPLGGDLTVIGSPAARLLVRSTAPDGHLILKLADVFPDGRSRQVAHGRLRLAHRRGHDRHEPLAPGEPTEVTVSFWPTANTFRAGHRVRLVVSASDAPYCEVFPEPSENAVLGTKDQPCLLELPVVS